VVKARRRGMVRLPVALSLLVAKPFISSVQEQLKRQLHVRWWRRWTTAARSTVMCECSRIIVISEQRVYVVKRGFLWRCVIGPAGIAVPRSRRCF